MKSPTFRCSFGVTQSSGLNDPLVLSPLGISHAIWLAISLTSMLVTRSALLSPLSSFCQVKIYTDSKRGYYAKSGDYNPTHCTSPQLTHLEMIPAQFNQPFFSRNLIASPTVRIFSAASSGISTPNSSSKAMTNSTVSRLSAPNHQ